MWSPCRVEFVSDLDRNEVSSRSFPVGSGSIDLISNEGITTVGLLEAFFPAVLGVSLCHPLVGQSALKRGGFHILLSSLLARTRCVSL